MYQRITKDIPARFGFLLALVFCSISTAMASDHAEHCPPGNDGGKTVEDSFRHKGFNIYHQTVFFENKNAKDKYVYCIDTSDSGKRVYVKWGNQDDPLFDKLVPSRMKLDEGHWFNGKKKLNSVELRFGMSESNLETTTVETYYSDQYAENTRPPHLAFVSAPKNILDSDIFAAKMAQYFAQKGTSPTTDELSLMSDFYRENPSSLNEVISAVFQDGEGFGSWRYGTYAVPGFSTPLEIVESNSDDEIAPDQWILLSVAVWSGFQLTNNKPSVGTYLFVNVLDRSRFNATSSDILSKISVSMGVRGLEPFALSELLEGDQKFRVVKELAMREISNDIIKEFGGSIELTTDSGFVLGKMKFIGLN